MDVRVGLFILLMLTANWVSHARNLAASDLLDVENTGENVEMCTLCKEYTTMALSYVKENKTQSEVIEYLHNACFQLHGLEEKCIILVDSYAALFFLEVSSVQPEEFCKKVGLCRISRISSLSVTTNKCEICHQAINDVLDKLKDPDTKLGIIEILLKTCDIMDKYAKKCKNWVFAYGPLILTDGEKFIEKLDICTTFHACRKPKADGEDALVDEHIQMVTTSSQLVDEHIQMVTTSSQLVDEHIQMVTTSSQFEPNK